MSLYNTAPLFRRTLWITLAYWLSMAMLDLAAYLVRS